ncbi:hypothetical protein [Streptomyces boluensis]|uniref:Uncharacterized protein n=1 Tax=Streptomyces boluensis TaxID=1775135 RepID=A0A964XNG5_9ACTN|nr:hypothetical protein [Streptomyces boluensis]NBE53767.1 hypothetical protein [Streptomyces boluensis]
MKGTPVKLVLWLVLLAALLTNLTSPFYLEGSSQALLSVGTGAVVVAAAGGLWHLRSRHLRSRAAEPEDQSGA